MNDNVNPPPVVAIIGPTAGGKTDLAIKLAERFKGAIISADSRQPYQHARVGSNQPIGVWRMANSQWQGATGNKKIFKVNGIPHLFIDILNPRQTYTAAKYQQAVIKLIPKLFAIGYLPILVGGTGLYVSAVTQNYNFPATTDKKLRAKLEKMSLNQLNKKLAKLDKLTYAKIDRANRRRLIRALEHILVSGHSFLAAQTSAPRPNTLVLGIKTSPAQLKQKISRRSRQMIKEGLIRETKYLRRYFPQSTLLKTIGYQEICGYLDKKYNLKTAINLINTHTWQYARRQLTWFKKMPRVIWLKQPRQANKLINDFFHSS